MAAGLEVLRLSLTRDMHFFGSIMYTNRGLAAHTYVCGMPNCLISTNGSLLCGFSDGKFSLFWLKPWVIEKEVRITG